MAETADIVSFPTKPPVDELIPHVEDGVYTLTYVCHSTGTYFRNALKVAFWFRVVDPGQHFGKMIPRYYNVKRFKGKKGLNGAFVPGRSSDFIREYCTLFTNPINRLDRLPMTPFLNVLIKGKTRTVTRSGNQKNLPESLYYSVIDELIGIDK